MLQKQNFDNYRQHDEGTRDESEEKSTRSRNVSLHRVTCWISCLYVEWWSSGFILGIVRILNFLAFFFCCYSRTFETSFVSTKYIRVEKFVFSRFHSDSHSANFFVFVSFAWITCLSFPIYQMFIFSNVEEIFFFLALTSAVLASLDDDFDDDFSQCLLNWIKELIGVCICQPSRRCWWSLTRIEFEFTEHRDTNSFGRRLSHIQP